MKSRLILSTLLVFLFFITFVYTASSDDVDTSCSAIAQDGSCAAPMGSEDAQELHTSEKEEEEEEEYAEEGEEEDEMNPTEEFFDEEEDDNDDEEEDDEEVDPEDALEAEELHNDVGPGMYLRLSTEATMPMVGMGLAAMKGEATRRSVRDHVAAGFRLFDGAEAKEWYDDEAAGSELSSIIQEGSVTREELFLVSKVHPVHLSYKDATEAVKNMLKNYNTTYMDLVLLHYPECGSWIPACQGKPGGDWRAAYRALEDQFHSGVVRHIGISNFHLEQLKELYEIADVEPHVYQAWIDPFHQLKAERLFLRDKDTRITSYSSLGTQWEHDPSVRRNLVWDSHVLREIAEIRDVSIPTVVMAWLLVQDIAVIPRSNTAQHIAENAELMNADFALEILTQEDIDNIDSLDDMYDVWDREVCATLLDECRTNSTVRDEGCYATCAGEMW